MATTKLTSSINISTVFLQDSNIGIGSSIGVLCYPTSYFMYYQLRMRHVFQWILYWCDFQSWNYYLLIFITRVSGSWQFLLVPWFTNPIKDQLHDHILMVTNVILFFLLNVVLPWNPFSENNPLNKDYHISDIVF